jgi:DNA polymerase III subunit epsilon
LQRIYFYMALSLNNPLIVFDLETTGINTSKDRIIELYMIKILPNGEEQHLHHRINPGMPIPKESTAIHGVVDADVADCPKFKDIGNSLLEFIGQSDFAGFNSNHFDFPLLVEEIYRAGLEIDVDGRKFVDAQRIYHKKEPRNLAAAYRFYCSKDLIDAHSAAADTIATWEVIKAQVEHYEDLENNVEFLHQFSGQNNLIDLAGRIRRNNEGEAVFYFGKYKGQSVADVFKKDPSYYNWMMRGDFAENTKRVVTKIRLSLLNT